MNRTVDEYSELKISVLSLTGIEDIIALGKKLRKLDHNVQRIISSPLQRTKETANLLSKSFHLLPETNENIREDFFNDGNIDHLKDIYRRFRKAADYALGKDGNSILVSHRLPISLFILIESGKTFEELSQNKKRIRLLNMGECFKAMYRDELFHFEKIVSTSSSKPDLPIMGDEDVIIN